MSSNPDEKNKHAIAFHTVNPLKSQWSPIQLILDVLGSKLAKKSKISLLKKNLKNRKTFEKIIFLVKKSSFKP